MKPTGRQYARARGFAAATVLFTIALFVLVGAASSTIARGNAKAKMFHEIKDRVLSQTELTLSLLLLCRTLYPTGDNTTGFHPQYPGAPTAVPLESVICPGSATSLWSGDSRAIAPRPLPGFNPILYVNDTNSVRLETTVISLDDYYTDLMKAVQRKMGDQVTITGNKLTIVLVE